MEIGINLTSDVGNFVAKSSRLFKDGQLQHLSASESRLIKKCLDTLLNQGSIDDKLLSKATVIINNASTRASLEAKTPESTKIKNVFQTVIGFRKTDEDFAVPLRKLHQLLIYSTLSSTNIYRLFGENTAFSFLDRSKQSEIMQQRALYLDKLNPTTETDKENIALLQKLFNGPPPVTQEG